MKTHSISELTQNAYKLLIQVASSLQSVFLLVIRLYWGWQFTTTGYGKLTNIAKITDFFQSLGIPFPVLNAYLAGMTECFGGVLLLLGLASRVVCLPLMFTMFIAYATAERDALHSLFTDPDKFTGATPFLFLLTAIIVFIFGPGSFSIDRLLSRLFKPDNDQGSESAK